MLRGLCSGGFCGTIGKKTERMEYAVIEVDISNVWGELALPELLAMEKAVFDAHMQLTEAEAAVKEEELLRIQRAAERIRANSQVCVMVGNSGSLSGARAAMELLQNGYPEGPGEPQVVFAGDSLSTRRWKALEAQLSDRDFSVIVVAGADMPVETGIALRSLRWMLERKYGTDEANARIYAITASQEGALPQMTREAGWETFAVNGGSVLTAAGLLPMAVAGIDVQEILRGAQEGREAYDLRSYENPVWLYAAVRSLLHRGGKGLELLASFEAGFGAFGSWWQRLFLESGRGLFPVVMEYPAGLHSLEQQGNALLETLIRFAPSAEEHRIGSDWKDLDGLNVFAGKTLSFVEEQTYAATVSAHADAGIPVITMDCGERNARTLGELFCFLELSCGISEQVSAS